MMAFAEIKAAFEAKYRITESGCWEWTAARIKPNSYGSFRVNGKHWVAHRFAYDTFVGPIPDGLFVCHSCNNKGCVNPSHLYVATNAQNIRDAYRDGLMHTANMSKTHCINGHPLSGDNLIPRLLPIRVCRACRNALNRAYKTRYRASLPPLARRLSHGTGPRKRRPKPIDAARSTDAERTGGDHAPVP